MIDHDILTLRLIGHAVEEYLDRKLDEIANDTFLKFRSRLSEYALFPEIRYEWEEVLKGYRPFRFTAMLPENRRWVDAFAVEVFRAAYVAAQKFVFDLTGANNEIDRLDCFASLMINGLIWEMGPLKILVMGGYNLERVREKLEFERMNRLEDAKHGISGLEPLKKEPSMTVVNSPGAIIQTAKGNNIRQAANVQTYGELINAIDSALASAELERLSPEQKFEFSDVADCVKEEASKAQPDAEKLMRWGKRLVDLAGKVGIGLLVAEIRSHLPI